MTIDFSNIMKDTSSYLTFQEVTKMFNYCHKRMDEYNNDRNFVMLMTLFYSARRITELVGERPYTKKVGLRPCDLKDNYLIEWDILKKNHIKTKTKTGQNKSEESLIRARLNKLPVRKLKPIKTVCYDWLEWYINKQSIQPTERIFSITSRRADQIVKRIALKCGIRRDRYKIHCHMFRHSYPIHLLKENPNNPSILRYVQQLLDHSDIKMTMTYTQFTPYDIQEVIEETR